MKVIILRGGSGVGKSTWIKNHYLYCQVFSADTFFVNADGDYNFEPSKLGEAHATCLRSFIEACQRPPADPASFTGQPAVAIVDNTNTSVSEFAPYAQVAQVYGHDVNIFTFLYDPVVAHKRNTHGTPLKACIEMHQRLMEQTKFIPPWWKHDYIIAE